VPALLRDLSTEAARRKQVKQVLIQPALKVVLGMLKAFGFLDNYPVPGAQPQTSSGNLGLKPLPPVWGAAFSVSVQKTGGFWQHTAFFMPKPALLLFGRKSLVNRPATTASTWVARSVGLDWAAFYNCEPQLSSEIFRNLRGPI
jgi:hypothetical protein